MSDAQEDALPELRPAAMVAGALTLTAALAWNEAAKTGIAALVPGKGKTFGATLAYAVAVTILVIIVLSLIRTVHRNIDTIKSAFSDEPATENKGNPRSQAESHLQQGNKGNPRSQAESHLQQGNKGNPRSQAPPHLQREGLIPHRVFMTHCH